jgi:hypothetical protein
MTHAQPCVRAASVGAYLYQLVVGIILIISPDDHGQVTTVAYLGIASFAVALSRAWSLVQGKHLRAGELAGTQPG